MGFILYALAAVLAGCAYTNGQSDCTTPTAKPGVCKSIEECPDLADLIRKPKRTQEDLNLLMKSSCGFEGDIPKVCCPNPCMTPNGEAGTCTNIKSCPHLEKMLRPPVTKENLLFVKNSRCGASPQIVCCGPALSLKVADDHSCEATFNAYPPEKKSKCCGRDINGEDRIIGGNYTTIEQYPWLALIEYRSRNNGGTLFLCGGALISARYVLTAAHCLVGPVLRVGKATHVRLGEYDTSNDGSDCEYMPPGATGRPRCAPPAISIAVEEAIPHPEYDVPVPGKVATQYNDIALIRLKEAAPYTDYIRPICLPSTPDVTKQPPPTFDMYVAGWGITNSTTGVRSPIKLYVQVPFVDKQICQESYDEIGRKLQEQLRRNPRRKNAIQIDTKLWHKQLCAGGEKDKDSCRGDSGGPLMYETDEGPYEAVGVVSFGPTPCGMENVPGVYTIVHEYLDWINNNIKP